MTRKRKRREANRRAPTDASVAAPATADGSASGETASISLRPQAKPRLAPLALLFLVQGLFIVLVLWLAFVFPPVARVIPIDSVALPGAECVLGVRLEREGPLRGVVGIPGVEVAFEAVAGATGAGEDLGRATTDAAGEAARRWKAPHAAGIYRHRVRVFAPDALSIEPGEVEILVQVVPEGGSLVFPVVEGTLRNGYRTLVEDEGAIPARAFLRELSQSSAIVYVGTRAGDVPSRLRSWLERNDFPPGTVRLMPAASFPGRDDLTPWKGRAWGICARERVARGFASAGLRAILLDGGSSLVADGRMIYSARNWADAKRIIEKSL